MEGLRSSTMIVLTLVSLTMMARGHPTLKKAGLDHPIRPQEGYYDPYVCQKCEEKRQKCFIYSLATTGACFGAGLTLGTLGRWSCWLATIPRTVDCYDNTWNECFLRDCGLVDF